MKLRGLGGHWLSVTGLACALAWPAAAQSYTYPELAGGLTNLEALAVLPAPGEHCALWSSYDRSSYYDTNSGQYINWDANNDCCGIIRMEGTNAVLAEMQGPGCIWRMWSATPAAGHVRIYLDGTNDPPALDLPFSAYFDGQHGPFTNAALVHTTPANGWNNYTPIPYQVSCKIVAEPGWGQYYHITYGTFPAGTTVPTFNPALSPADAAALANVNQVLSHCGSDPAGIRLGQTTLSNTVTAEGTSTQLVAQLAGPAAITALRVKLDLPGPPADYDLLRELALQIKWDGEAAPSVWAPLGDFFGTAPGSNTYSSLPLGHTADGWWYCYWYMPFATSARVELVNDDTNAHQVVFQVTSAPLSRPIGELGRFHAKWHRDAFLPTAPGRDIDWTILKCAGAGRFVGTMLHVYNPGGGWWGEGDEKFFVDGEPFPSSFGTGSEDYFGYAWSSPVLFQHALHNQTHNDGGNKGHISVNRWHISDSVPFQQSFEGCIEKYFSNQRPTLYAAMAYWYLAPGGQDPYAQLPLNQRLGYWTTPVVFRVPGALEGEDLQILSISAGTTQSQDMSGFTGQWSNDAQLWWTGGHPGDSLALALPVTNSGTYKLSLQMTKARDYGIIQLYLDGLPLGSPVDLYSPTVEPTGPIVLGDHSLSAGQHVLTAQILGANTNAVLSYMFGLDYIKLESPLTASDALNLGNPAGDLAVVFSTAVDPATATNAEYYTLDFGATVTSARLGATPDTVVLRTTGLNPGTPYTLSISNVRDTASPPNTIPSNTTVRVEQDLNTWLRLDETAGTTAADSSGNGADGSLVSDALPGYEGKVLRSVKFAGTLGGYIQLPGGYANFTTNGLTVALWANPTTQGADANWDRFVDLGNGPASDNILLARNSTTARLTFEVYNGNTSGGKVNSPDGTLVVNQWQHLAATLDPWGNVALYKNGLLLTNGVTGVPGLVTRTRNFLGLSNWTGDDHYAGRMDDVRIYNRVLSPAAILALANGGGPDDIDPANSVVSAVATVPTTALTNTAPGVFTLSRSGNTNSALTVHYALSGTATNGQSYEWLTGSATFPPGTNSVPLLVIPIAHAFVEPSQTAILTLTGRTGYSIGESDTATVTINNNELTPGPVLAAGWNRPAGNSGIIDVWFRTPMSLPSSTVLAHYSLPNAPGVSLTNATLDSRALRVVLDASGPLPADALLSVAGLTDAAGNSISNQLPIRLQLTPADVLANIYHAPSDRPTCFSYVTDETVNNTDNSGTGFDTYGGSANIPLTQFAGLLYNAPADIEAVKVDLGQQFGDGGNWQSAPQLFLLKNLVDTDTAHPEGDPTNWVQVPAQLISGSQFQAAADANPSPSTPLVFYLSALPAAERLAYGWAVGGVRGNGANGFISLSELTAFGSPSTPPLPSLAIEAGSTNLTVSWPGWAGSFGLESTTHLQAPTTWAPVPGVPRLEGGRYQISLPLPAASTYYRLKR